ncbi:DUF551 domain-containing protein [Klebsiella pasteurii]|uniref:DUF551 domain-containing protein n=1 Tax=Klebsiella pasteurii TaxID=2587529 RepID=UPI003F1D9453
MKFEEWLASQNGTIEVDCGCVETEAFYHWLRAAYEAGNSPVIPEGWQVEAEKLAEMHGMSFVLFRHGEAPQCADPTKVVISFTDKGLGHDTEPQSAPQNIPEIIPGWIPVRERMPGSQEWVIVFAKWANQQVLCWDDVQNRWTDFEDQSYYADMFTHWMPLPAGPKEEK